MPQTPIPVSLVLGSGGARGLAHIGVIRALDEDGRFAVHSITGASIGALIGGLYAGGRLQPYADWVCSLTRSDVWGLLDFSFTGRGLFEGRRLMAKLADLVGDVRIEELPIPFTAVASDIERRREVWLNRGSLFEAIRASIAIPGVFTPVARGGRLLVDGGLLSPLPIAPTLGHDGDRTIAVSLNGAAERNLPPAAAPSADRSALARWLGATRRKLGVPKGEGPSVGAFDTIARSIEAMQDRIARYQVAAYRPDILIEIPVDACGVLDFHRGPELIELGYRQARAALQRAPDGDGARGF